MLQRPRLQNRDIPTSLSAPTSTALLVTRILGLNRTRLIGPSGKKAACLHDQISWMIDETDTLTTLAVGASLTTSIIAPSNHRWAMDVTVVLIAIILSDRQWTNHSGVVLITVTLASHESRIGQTVDVALAPAHRRTLTAWK